MMILGLGSNVGDRLSNLRLAIECIKDIPEIAINRASPIYISDALLPPNAPLNWDRPYLNLCLACDTSLSPHDLLQLLKKIEMSIGRKPTIRHWGPRVIDLDILALDDIIIQDDKLTVPHPELIKRPFALWPLADVAPFWRYPLTGPDHGKTAAEIILKWGSRFTGEAPFKTKQINQRIASPCLMGILNITPDSFSDGGMYQHVDDAKIKVRKLIEDGAEIIDIGAASTRPGAKAITHQEEWARLEPVLLAIKEQQSSFFIPPKLSIDTHHPEVAENALNLDIDFINDVTGLDHDVMIDLVKNSGSHCILMHHLFIPENRDHHVPLHENILDTVLKWGDKKINQLLKAGVELEKIIFDPGIGFGKVAEQSMMLIKNMDQFKKLGTKLLVGHSRKTFLSLFQNRPFDERDIHTAIVSLYLNQQVDYLRVHNVLMTAEAFRINDVF